MGREEMFEKHKRLAMKVSGDTYRYMYRRCKAQFIEQEDFDQMAYIGLLKSIDRFDESYGYKFSTYAVPTIKNEMLRFMRDKASIIRVPRVHGARDQESIDDILAHYYRSNIESFEKPFGPDGEKEMTLEDKIGVDDYSGTLCQRIDMEKALNSLGERERYCIIEFFFNERKQIDIGKDIGVTQVQVSRLIRKAIEEMRITLGVVI